jgi:hypothetical protein
MSEPPPLHTRVILVADPDADPAIISAVVAILVWAQVAVTRFSSAGDSLVYKQEMLRISIDDPQTDVVVVVRSEPQPSREAREGVATARQLRKPVHVVVARGISAGVEADETHMIALDRTWETDQDLYAWARSLAERFGRPVHGD